MNISIFTNVILLLHSYIPQEPISRYIFEIVPALSYDKSKTAPELDRNECALGASATFTRFDIDIRILTEANFAI